MKWLLISVSSRSSTVRIQAPRMLQDSEHWLQFRKTWSDRVARYFLHPLLQSCWSSWALWDLLRLPANTGPLCVCHCAHPNKEPVGRSRSYFLQARCFLKQAQHKEDIQGQMAQNAQAWLAASNKEIPGFMKETDCGVSREASQWL